MKDTPTCPLCDRAFTLGDTWKGANYCRGSFLAEALAQHGPQTAWGLSQLLDLGYEEVQRGLMKARDAKVVVVERQEPLADDKYRNIYASDGVTERFREMHDTAVSMNHD